MLDPDVAEAGRLRSSESPIIQLAEYAHRDQVDKAGKPYILHPLRVANRVAREGGTFHTVTAAWLHDVVEDTSITLEDLMGYVRMGYFYPHALRIVEAMTHRPNEPRDVYIARILEVGGGKSVKRADILDNTDPMRLAVLDLRTQKRLVTKYVRDLTQMGYLDDALRVAGYVAGS